MGVPITFMEKDNPDQFEIVGITKTWFRYAVLSMPLNESIGPRWLPSAV
jgi:hypothetical protein